ncbi:MAG: nickel-dependent lactate racemase [Candidatus Sumerlaeaceae bacterium]|nr:nickel-dependent lactate racemase [Candidatus Sumerlaeaceae bacterium]
MKTITFPYGTTALDVSLPDSTQVLLPNTSEPAGGERAIVRRALENPINCAALYDLAKGRRSAIILISCRTRRTGSQIFVPEMLEVLNAAGIPDDRILVYTATGTHDNYRPEDAELLIGPDAAKRLRIMGHDCRTPEKLVEVGTTSRGNVVRLSRTYLNAELKIAAGRVTYHYFAGFSAGRKSVLPGVSAFETIMFNHAMAVIRDGDIRLNPEARNGNLKTNPIHLDMIEAAKMAPPDFAFATIGNARNEITHAFAGDMVEAHGQATTLLAELDGPRLDAPADLAVIGCGGAPYDVNTIQAIKALLNNYKAVRPGGAIVWAGECPEGSPEWLLKACAIPELAELQRQIAAKQVRQAHNPLWIRGAREHANVFMVTTLPDSDVAALGLRKAPTMQAAVEMAAKLCGEPKRVIAIPYANLTVARMANA